MRVLTCLCVLLLTIPAAAETPAPADVPVLEVHQMMLGCADGYLLRVGDTTVLIDGGEANPRKPERGVTAYLRAAGVEKIDVIIITHWHLDHCMSLHEVMAEFGSAETVVYSPAESIPEAIDNGSVVVPIGPLALGEYRQMKMGDVLSLDGMTITCIGPEELHLGGGCNQDSLNFVVQYGSRRILFTGDFAQSRQIAGEYRELCSQVDVLKFPHHGVQPFEIGQAALRVVRPTYVLVPGVVNKYKLWNFADDNGVKFPRDNVVTNADGHVVILTDGQGLFEIHTQIDPVDFAGE